MMAAQTDTYSPALAPSQSARRSITRWTPRLIAWLALAAFVLVTPSVSYNWEHYAGYICIFVVMGLSMNVLVGYTGQISLGQQAFLGLGTMVAANVASTGTTYADGFSFAVSIVAAAASGAAAALLLGAVALRIRGLYLALVTLLFGSTFVDAILTLPSLNGHDAGVPAYRPSALSGEYSYYLFSLAIVAICIYVDYWVRRTKLGRGLVALRDNEMVASAMGVDVLGYKLLGFTISGAMAGLAGALFCYWTQEFSDKDFTQNAGFTFAITFVVMVVVGGLGNRAGVIWASVFFALVSPIIPLLAWIADHTGWGGFYGDHKYFITNVIGAVLLLQTVILNPGGLGQIVRPISRWMSGRRFDLHDEGSGFAAGEGGAVRA